MLGTLETQPALIDQVHDRLLTAVVDGTLAPGQRLTQDQIAHMLGVSRQPVSHAIQMLRRRGLLVESGKRGVAVAPIDAQRIRDLYQLRAALDGLAAELAAGRRRSGETTAAEIADLKASAAVGAQETLDARQPNLALLIEADVTFHSMLYRLSGNSAIVDTVAEQWPHFRRSMRQVLESSAAVARRVWTEHAAIADAVAAGDVAQSGHLARLHAVRAAEETTRRVADEKVPAGDRTQPAQKRRKPTQEETP